MRVARDMQAPLPQPSFAGCYLLCMLHCWVPRHLRDMLHCRRPAHGGSSIAVQHLTTLRLCSQHCSRYPKAASPLESTTGAAPEMQATLS
jgi:hypothetical protein